MYFHQRVIDTKKNPLLMKYFYTFLTLFLFSSVYSIAQTNYKPGFLITGKGETISGFINYKEWNYNPANVTYKKSLTDKAQTFLPTEVSYFEVTGYEAYRAAHVSVSMGRTDMQMMKGEIDSTITIQDVFLKQLDKGDNVTLYAYADNVKTRFYIGDNKSTDAPQELVYQAYYDAATSTVKSKNGYNLQLIALAKKYRPDNFELQDKIVQTKYKEKELLAVVTLINNIDPNKKIENGNHKPAVSLFAGLGINVSDIHFAATQQATTQTAKTSYYPKVTIGVDAPFNPNVGRLLFRTELSFTMARADITVRSADQVSTTTSTFKLNQQTIALKPQIIYNIYNTDNLKVYAGAGINVNFTHYPASANKTAVVNDVPSLSYKREDDFASSTNLWFQIAPKAGFTIGQKWDVGINYFVPTNISDIGAMPTIRVKGFDVGVSYYFGK
jgi:hypothetical protein